jgi:hypothetical protein
VSAAALVGVLPAAAIPVQIMAVGVAVATPVVLDKKETARVVVVAEHSSRLLRLSRAQ